MNTGLGVYLFYSCERRVFPFSDLNRHPSVFLFPRITKRNSVEIQSKTVTIPVKQKEYAIYWATDSAMILDTTHGFQLMWDGLSRVELRVSKEYRKNVRDFFGSMNFRLSEYKGNLSKKQRANHIAGFLHFRFFPLGRDYTIFCIVIEEAAVGV